MPPVFIWFLVWYNVVKVNRRTPRYVKKSIDRTNHK
jgi:hypothetical protein